MTEYICANCGRSFIRYSMLNKLCGVCLYNKSKKTKPIKQFGKVTLKWLEVRNEFLQKNPPVDGYWYCYIGGEPLTIDQLTVDHVVSRSRAPELRYEQSNLAACCFKHNKGKGSLSLEEYKLKLKEKENASTR